jgi:hypothetical protein
VKAKWSELSFEDLELLLYRLAIAIIREALARILEDLDKYFALVRDRNRYKAKEIEERVVDSLVGPIRFKRRYYVDLATGEGVYLLDERLKLLPYQRVSPGLAKVAVSLAAQGPSYRAARDRLEEITGERLISHEGIRQMVLKTGRLIAGEETDRRRPKKSGIVFIEADGLWTGRQGKKGRRKRHRKRESRLAVVHEGWRPRYPGSQEYETIPLFKHLKTQGTPEEFWEDVYEKLDRYYDLETTLVVINGDGAEWIRKGVEYFPLAIYQYDRFHIAREVQRALSWEQSLKAKALSALRDNELDRLIRIIDQAEKRANEDDRPKVQALKRLVEQDHEYILDYRIRLAQLGYNCQGLRGLGAGESNVGKFKVRTRGRSWSTTGLGCLANVLFALINGNLHRYTQQLTGRFKENEEKVVSSAAQLLRKAVHRVEPAIRRGHFPCLERGTHGYAELFRQILREGFSLY